ncbi:MAG: type II toxin-antitoxin system HipA family toxin [Endomicrobium sp.]|jgi:serine/threonine-protein kinase HipA|nr:type II toxin-antitoxin system HipA family toxin [Endomicrobium sp.]
MNTKQLSVRLFGEEVGILEQDKNGKLHFTYSDTAKIPISWSLPLDKKSFSEKECRPYFNGLLPESEHVRNNIAKIYGINANSDFAILKTIGHDCAGALSLHAQEEPIKKAHFVKLEGYPQTEESLSKHIKALPEHPFFMEKNNDVRLSLAGTQDKAPISLIDGKICIPRNGTPSTHILKPLIKNLNETVLNEYICMRLAGALGINVPKVEIKSAKNVAYLLIERYDREVSKDTVMRIHQEDFCQALGILSINKYQADGGPGFKQCFELLNITQLPAKAKLLFMKTVMFNYLIGNNDAHGKNFSLLYKNKKPILAPAYDILSTETYPILTKKMAMKIGSSYEKGNISNHDWQALCNNVEYSFLMFKKEFLEMCELLPKAVGVEINLSNKSISHDVPDKIKKVVLENIKKLKLSL